MLLSNWKISHSGNFMQTAIVLLTLTGCANMPEPAEHAQPKSITAYATDQSFTAPVSDWPGDHWWEEIKDQQLAVLITEGLSGASDMRIAQARFAAANAAVGGAKATLLPSVNLGGSVTEVKSSQNSLLPAPGDWDDIAQTSLDLNWTLDFWGKNRAALDAAKAGAKSAEAEAQAARLLVSTGIAASYANLSGLYKERDTAANARNVRAKTADLMAKRQREGLENEGAAAQARAGKEQAEADLDAIDEQIALVRNQIAALMGAGPDRGLAIERPALPMDKVFGLPENLSAELLGRRPDVVAARFRVEAATKDIDRAKAEFYPNINLMALIGFQSLGLNNLLLAHSQFGSAGPAFSLPIFDGGHLRAQYRGAEADYAEAVAVYDGTLTQALREVADAAVSRRALSGRLNKSRAAEAAARTAWTIATNRYRGGLGTYLDVLSAENAFIQSSRQVTALEARSITLHIALIRALGGGYHS